jgi:hypothetical protein
MPPQKNAANFTYIAFTVNLAKMGLNWKSLDSNGWTLYDDHPVTFLQSKKSEGLLPTGQKKNKPQRSRSTQERINPKSEYRNPKWFDQPFVRLTVLSRVEGLTTLSQVEGQIQIFFVPFRELSPTPLGRVPSYKIQMTKTTKSFIYLTSF